MMISLIWPLRAKGRNRILGVRWSPFLLGSCWFEGSWKMRPILGGVSNVWLGGGFEHFFYFQPRKLGRWSNLTTAHMFQRCETTIQLDNWTPPSQQKFMIFFFKKKKQQKLLKTAVKNSHRSTHDEDNISFVAPSFWSVLVDKKHTFFLLYTMEPENTPLQKENHLPDHYFQVLC